MLLGNNSNKVPGQGINELDEKTMESCAILLNGGHLEEAWTLLNLFRQESIPQLFNKAICLIAVEDYAAALPLLERARMLLASLRSNMKTQESPILKKIQEKQNATEVYRRAVTSGYVEQFPEILKDSVLRLIVDCYSNLGNTDKVIEIGTPLKNKGYRNVTEALSKINKPGDLL